DSAFRPSPSAFPPQARLVTLTGAGGTGKTRLALQVGVEVTPQFVDGVFFVSLAAIAEPELVVDTVARALGVTQEGSRPLLDSIKERLREKQALLLLDNCEQVIAATPHVAALLASCPDLKILATSREALRMHGEYEYHVPPLELPETQQHPGV